MKKYLLATTLLGALIAGSAMADGFSYNIGSSTDYMFRGITQTKNSVAVQGGVDYAKGTSYAGVWASNVDFGDSTNTEVDFYAGIKPTVGIVTLDLGGILYTYYNQPKGSHVSTGEFKVAASMPIGKGTIGAAVFTSLDDYKADGMRGLPFADSMYGELNGSYPIAEGITVSGALGNTKLKNGNFATPSKTVVDTDQYSTMNLGATVSMTKYISLDVRYWDTNRHDFGAAFKPKSVVTIKAAF